MRVILNFWWTDANISIDYISKDMISEMIPYLTKIIIFQYSFFIRVARHIHKIEDGGFIIDIYESCCDYINYADCKKNLNAKHDLLSIYMNLICLIDACNVKHYCD